MGRQPSRTTAPLGSFDFDFGPTLAKPQPPVIHVCKHFNIVKGRPTFITGYAGSIKTWLAQDLALAVAAGLPTIWGGVEIQVAGPVRHLCYENLAEVTARRYQRLAAGRGINLATLGNSLGRAALPTTYITTTDAEEMLVKVCDGIALVIIDSLRAACPDVDENDSKIRKYVDMLQRVTAKTGAVMVVIHHERKAGGDDSDGIQAMRGSSALADAIDCSVRVARCDEPDVHRLTQGKHAWGTGGQPIALRLLDEGVCDPASGMSTALRFGQVEDPTPTRVSGVERCMGQIRRLLRSGPMGAREIRDQVKGRNQDCNDALALMRKDGEVTQDEGKRYALAATGLSKGAGLSKDAPDAEQDEHDFTPVNHTQLPRTQRRVSRVSPRVPGPRQGERVPVSPPFRAGHASTDTRSRSGQ